MKVTNHFELQKYIEYLELIPRNELIENLDKEELEKSLFDAYEDILQVASDIPISPRMVVKQLIYKVENENQGYASMKRAGVKSQKINDASIEFIEGSLSPEVWDIILLFREKSKGRVGRLI